MSRRAPPLFRPGEPLSAAKLNRLVDFVRDWGNLNETGRGAGLAGASRGQRGAPLGGPWPCNVVAAVGAETVFADERYWVTSRYCSLAAGDVETQVTLADQGAPALLRVPATNLAELVDGTHNVPVGAEVLVWQVNDSQAPPIPHYVFWSEVPRILFGKVTVDWDADDRFNYLTVNPCDKDGNNVQAGTEVTVYIGWPPATGHSAPAWVAWVVDDVVPYLPLDNDEGLICGVLWGQNVWGKVAIAWVSPNNFVWVRLCTEAGAEVGVTPNVKCYLYSPATAAPTGVTLAVDDIIPLVILTSDAGVPVAYAYSIFRTVAAAGAPADASYVVLGLDGDLDAERVLTGSASILVTDNGANDTVVISVDPYGIDHGGLGGLGDNDHPQYSLTGHDHDYQAGLEADLEGEGDGYLLFDDTGNTITTEDVSIPPAGTDTGDMLAWLAGAPPGWEVIAAWTAVNADLCAALGGAGYSEGTLFHVDDTDAAMVAFEPHSYGFDGTMHWDDAAMAWELIADP